MPAILPSSTPSLVLVTGANSYLGAWIVKTLLIRGIDVRASVRSSTKADELRTTVIQGSPANDSSPYEGRPGSLEFAIVEDMSKEGAFDEAVAGVDAIIHTASPSVLRNPNATPNDIIQPAIQGNLNLLRSALRLGLSTLKRIVITSSAAAFSSSESRAITEDDWDEIDAENIKDSIDSYRASKVLAEQAAWDFYKTHKPEINWDLTILLPTFMFGPPLYAPSNLGGTHKMFLDTIITTQGRSPTKETLASGDGYLDVRDAAEAHVRALEREGARGERIILNARSYVWQEWLDLANEIWDSLPWETEQPFALPKGHPELTEIAGKTKYPMKFDTGKEKWLLGTEYRSMVETMRDLLVDAIRKKWV